MRYFIIALLVLTIILLFWNGCAKKANPIIRIIPVEVIKEKIVTIEKEVVKWKDQKTKIIYKTHFDTLATIDTVIVELIKCDSIVKIDALIIAGQDSIIVDKNIIISGFEAEQQEHEKEVKQIKKKLLFTKII